MYIIWIYIEWMYCMDIYCMDIIGWKYFIDKLYRYIVWMFCMNIVYGFILLNYFTNSFYAYFYGYIVLI